MTILLPLWLLAALSEFLLYKYLPEGRKRAWWTIATLVLVVVSSTGLLFLRWPVWLAAWFFGGYRVVNLLRLLKARLPREELKKISLRAFTWIVSTQVAATIVAWSAAEHLHGAAYALDVLVSVQLLVTFIILRVTVNTWRHTQPRPAEAALSDKELPSVSILIPARNESDELEACLTHLVASDYPKLEIIVLDDCSANRRTPEIIRSFAQDGVRFVQGDVPDESRWLPKNQAYERLSHEASGELLVFCGVDVIFGVRTVRQLVETLLVKDKDMLSVLPLRSPEAQAEASLLQPMRYFWELCLPRRFFKRPPVLSTCWIIRADVLKRDGGFEAVSRSVVPEAHFARLAVIGDRYSFMRADVGLEVVSTKLSVEQYATTVRTRYPQLHRRLELVMFAAVIELVGMLGPFVGLLLLLLLGWQWGVAAVWVATIILLQVVYYLVAVRTKLNNPWFSWALFPAAVLVDVFMLHVSMWKYEFSEVTWKGRDISTSVMRVEAKFPPLPERIA